MATLLRPLIRLLVGFIAIPLFRLFLKRVVPWQKLDAELTKDLEQWVRGSLLLLVATDNFEFYVFGEHLSDWKHPYLWLSLGLRLLLAVGVIESMPDQALFSIIHPGPERLLLPKGRRIAAVREQFWPFCKGMFYRHLDRSSSVLAIMAVIVGAPDHKVAGWVCYVLSIIQFLIIGLVSSRDKALDVLSEFDKQVKLRRDELAALNQEWGEDDDPPSPPVYRGL
jgi:hypothetical protein